MDALIQNSSGHTLRIQHTENMNKAYISFLAATFLFILGLSLLMVPH